MVEKRIERVREKEKSVLYKVGAGKSAGSAARKESISVSERTGGIGSAGFDAFQAPEAAVLSEADTARRRRGLRRSFRRSSCSFLLRRMILCLGIMRIRWGRSSRFFFFFS
jgi:hypothetical protein